MNYIDKTALPPYIERADQTQGCFVSVSEKTLCVYTSLCFLKVVFLKRQK